MKKGFIFLIPLIGTVLLLLYFLNASQLYSQSIRLDESQSLWVSSKPLVNILQTISQDVHVPLYAVLLHFWIQIFGNDIIFARTLSLLFFVLTLPALYFMAKESSSKTVAILTVIFFALSPFMVWYASEARMYTLFAFITVLNHLFFLRFHKSDTRHGKLGLFVTSIIGFYTHYFFLLIIATQGIFLCIATIMKALKDREVEEKPFIALLFQNKKQLIVYIFVLICSFVFFVPWIYFVISQGSASNTKPLIPAPTSYNVFATFINFVFGFQTQAVQGLLISLWPLVIILFFFIFTQRKRVKSDVLEYFCLATFLPVLLAFLMSYVRPVFLSRYLILVTPTLFFLLAWVLINIAQKWGRYIGGLFIIALIILMHIQNSSAQTPVKEDYQGVTQYLSQNTTPQEVIAVTAPFTIYPVEYTYKGTSKLVTIPDWNQYKSGSIPPFSLANLQKQIEGYKNQYENIYVVLSYDQGYEKDVRNFFDNHFTLLYHHVFSPGLELRKYKLRYY
jgi:uncharacterized membrane protein